MFIEKTNQNLMFPAGILISWIRYPVRLLKHWQLHALVRIVARSSSDQIVMAQFWMYLWIACGVLTRVLVVKCYSDSVGSGVLDLVVPETPSQEPTTRLHLLSVLPTFDNEVSDIVPAARLAIELINNRSDILNGYDLDLIEADSGCGNDLPGLIGLVPEVFHSGKRIAGIVGPVCSKSTVMISSLLNLEDVALINIHLAGTDDLTNRNRYPYAFGTFGPVVQLAAAAVQLMQQNHWNEVVALYDDRRTYYNSMYFNFERLLLATPDYQVTSSSRIASFRQNLTGIQGVEPRIIFLMAGLDESRRIMCFAYHQAIVYPSYQWVLADRQPDHFNVSIQAGQYNCSGIELASALRNGILYGFRLDSLDRENITDLGISYNDFIGNYSMRMSEQNSVNQEISTKESATAYADSIFSMALALNNSIPALAKQNMSLENYGYGNTVGTNIIAESILDLDFAGVSGRIRFDNDTGFIVDREIYIYQVQGNISEYNSSKWSIIDSKFTEVTVYVHIAIRAVNFVIMIPTLCVIVVIHILSIGYRQFETVKASSLHLNHLAYAGVYLLFLDTLMLSVRTGFPVSEQAYGGLCNASNLFFYAGTTLLLGTVCVKTWRIYRIFVHYLDPGPFLSSRYLSAFVLMLLGVDILVWILWVAIDPAWQQAVRGNPDINGTVSVEITCNSEYGLVWIGILSAYELLIIACAFWLAILSRHIKHKWFVTRGVARLTYLSFFQVALGLALLAIFSIGLRSVVLEFVVTIVLFYIWVALFLIFVFLPPVLPLLKRKVFVHIHGMHHLRSRGTVTCTAGTYI